MKKFSLGYPQLTPLWIAVFVDILSPIVGGILHSLPNDIFYGLALSILSIIPFIMSFQVLKFGYDNRIVPSTKIQPVKTL